METLQEKFKELYLNYVATKKEDNDKLITFLEELNDSDKKNIAAEVKKLHNSGPTDAGGLQVLCTAAFICYDEKDWVKMFVWRGHDFFNKETMDRLLPRRCPQWFNNYVNNNGTALTYKHVLDYAEKGYLQPSEKLIAEKLARSVNFNEEHAMESFLYYKETLASHIWFLFEYETDICFLDNYYIKRGFTNDGNTWQGMFKKYTEEKHIDRMRLLQTSLLSICKGFSQTLTGWYAELFLSLQPTEAELLALQGAAFQVLIVPYSKPVHIILQLIKDVADSNAFDYTAFVNYMPVLFATGTKASMLIIINIAEKILKEHSNDSVLVSEQLCLAFLSKDVSVQTKAAKLIEKYASKYVAELSPIISSYHDTLLTDVKKILANFLQVQETAIEENTHIEPVAFITEENRIQVPANIDELIFLAGRAFNNNEPFHIDFLPAALIELHSQIKEEHIVLLEPALQQAYKSVMNEMTGNSGMLDNLLATFFIQYAQLLTQQYSRAAKNIVAMHNEYKRKTAEKNKYDKWGVQELGVWAAPYSKGNEYETHKRLLVAALQKIEQQDVLPMLSTPTHSPAYIHIDILAKRLQAYQAFNKIPNSTDFQVAIARCKTDDKETSKKIIEQTLGGEYKNLLLFLIQDRLPQPPFNYESAWLMAGLMKNPSKPFEVFKNFTCNTQPQSYLTGQYKWQLKTVTKKYADFDPKARKYVDVTKEEGVLTSNFVIANYLQNSSRQMVQESLKFNLQYVDQHSSKDIARIIFLLPDNPEAVLAQVIMQCLSEVNFAIEGNKKKVIKSLEAVNALDYRFSETSHWFIAASMIASDKTCRSYSGEIYANRVLKDTIDSRLLGCLIGKMYANEMAPVKRFTDLAHESFYKRSAKHNQSLQQLLDAIIVELPQETIKDLKKLLELYYEVSVANISSVSNDVVIAKLQQWKSSSTLKSIISKLERL